MGLHLGLVTVYLLAAVELTVKRWTIVVENLPHNGFETWGETEVKTKVRP